MHKWTGLTLAAVLVAAATLGAAAQQHVVIKRFGHPGSEMPPGPPFAMLEEMLQLTDAQKASLKAIHEEERRAAEPLLDQIRQHHEAIRTALDSEVPDALAIGQETIAAHQVEKQLAELHGTYREKLAAQLTDEQREKLAAFEKEHGPIPGPGMRIRVVRTRDGHTTVDEHPEE